MVVIELEVLIGDVDEVKFGQLSSSEPNHHFSKPKVLGSNGITRVMPDPLVDATPKQPAHDVMMRRPDSKDTKD